MKLVKIEQNAIARVWPLVESHLGAGLSHSQGEYNTEHAKVYLCTGAWHLIVAIDDDNEIKGAAAVEFMNRPNDRVAFVVTIGGKLISSKDTFEQLSGILRACGATKIEGAARESIARLWSRYGFAEKYRIVGVDL